MGRAGLINSGGESRGATDLQEAVITAVVNKRAGGMGLISGRKAFQKEMNEGIELLHTIQDVYLDPDITRLDIRYMGIQGDKMPLTESLEDAIARSLPYWKEVIVSNMKNFDQLLVVAHGNSLRGIIKYLKHISPVQIHPVQDDIQCFHRSFQIGGVCLFKQKTVFF